MSDRKALSEDFLARCGWNTADRGFLAGDASDRTYDRLTRSETETAVLMDAPPGKGDDPAIFIAIADHLRGIGVSSPRILSQDLTNGFLLLEDLGDALFARVLFDRPDLEPALYRSAIEVLVTVQSHPAPHGLMNLSATDWAAAAGMALDWYCLAATGTRPDPTDFTAALSDAISRHADGPRVMILRDYHAENLLHLPDREGVAGVGVLDFQLAQMGQPVYDLVSLLQDARRDVSPDLAGKLLAEFASAKGADPDVMRTAYAVFGAQRALRILGIFARLCIVGGKAGYLPLLPRVWAHLELNLGHPALAELRGICRQILPPPTDDVIQRIRSQCATRSP